MTHETLRHFYEREAKTRLIGAYEIPEEVAKEFIRDYVERHIREYELNHSPEINRCENSNNPNFASLQRIKSGGKEESCAQDSVDKKSKTSLPRENNRCTKEEEE